MNKNKNSQINFEQIVRDLPIPLYIKNIEHKFCYVNKAYRNLLLRKKVIEEDEDIIGLSDEKFFTGKHVKDASDDEKRIQKTKKPIIDKEEEEVWKSKDGQGRPELKYSWTITSKLPWLNNDGEVIGTYGISKEFTDIKLDLERYGLTKESSTGGLWYWDTKSRKITADDYLRNALGYSKDELGDDVAKWDELIHEEDRRALLRKFNRHIKGETSSYRHTYRLRKKSDDWIWLDVTAKALRSSEGNVIAILGSYSDITELQNKAQRYERELLDKESWIESLMMYAQDGIFFKDLDSNFVLVNKALADWADLDPMQLEGQNDEIFVGKEGARESRDEDLKIIRLGEGITNRLREIKTPSGRLRKTLVSKYPIRNASSDITGIVGISKDITEYLELLQWEEMLQIAVQNSANFILVTDSEGLIEYVNPAFEQETGYRLDDIRGRNVNILKSGKHEREYYENLWNTIRAGKVWRGDFTNRKKNDEIFETSGTVSPVIIDDNITHFVAVSIDITEQRRMQSKLYQSKVDFWRNLTYRSFHQIGNQIASAKVQLALIEETDADCSAGRLQSIKDRLDTVERFMSEYRTYHWPNIVINNMDIRGHFENIVDRFRDSFPSYQNIFLEITTSIRNYRCDAKKIDDSLWELLLNATHYTPATGRIDIIVDDYKKANEMFLRIRITDSGQGVSPSDKESIFEVFHTTRDVGTGIGLAVVKSVIDSHDGTITERGEYGKGAIFEILLPTDEQVN